MKLLFKNISSLSFRHIFSDFIASCVVFILGIPVALGIALHVGSGMASGMVAAAVGGIVGGAFGGVPLQVVGPIVALSGILKQIHQDYGLPALCAMTMMTGILQMIFAWLGLWRLALKIPKKVLQGMMAAVGLSVVISQFPMMLGHHPIHAMMGLGTLCVIILYEQYATYLNRMVPSSLFALVLAGLITGSFNLPLTRAETPTSIAQALQDIGLAQQFQHWWPHLQNHTLEILTFIFMIACISSIQSLLAGIGLNTIQPHESARLKRDLTAIGLANMISGYLGGLPVAGVILRGQANRAAGAVSNLSAFLSGVWTLSAILLLGPVLKNIPLASLAAIFILIGYKMLRLKDTVSFYRNGTLWVHWSTAFIGWRVGLLWGIACGFLIDWLLTRLQQKSNTEVLETSPP